MDREDQAQSDLHGSTRVQFLEEGEKDVQRSVQGDRSDEEIDTEMYSDTDIQDERECGYL